MAPNPPPPPWKNQRIRGARVAWAPKNVPDVDEILNLKFL